MQQNKQSINVSPLQRLRSAAIIILFRGLKSAATLLIILLLTSVALASRDPFLSNNSPIQNIGNTEKIFIKLHYVDAETLAKMLTDKKNELLSSSGYVNIDKRSNSLWIEDYASNLHNIQKFVNVFDHSTNQIQIEARIASVDADFTNELGLEFGTVQKMVSKNDNQNADSANTLTPGRFDFAIAKLANDSVLDMRLSALENAGHGKIISRPKLVTIDRMPAYISSGDEIPYQEKTGEGNTSIAFKKAALSLQVTPELLTAEKILLHLKINQDKVSQLLYNGQPAISTREINTQAVVKSSETIVLGGVYEDSQDNLTESIPVLGKIPLFGQIFTYKKNINQHKELLIFITPKIIS
jgi:type IV pilus assembly protein PilQ